MRYCAPARIPALARAGQGKIRRCSYGTRSVPTTLNFGAPRQTRFLTPKVLSFGTCAWTPAQEFPGCLATASSKIRSFVGAATRVLAPHPVGRLGKLGGGWVGAHRHRLAESRELIPNSVFPNFQRADAGFQRGLNVADIYTDVHNWFWPLASWPLCFR